MGPWIRRTAIVLGELLGKHIGEDVYNAGAGMTEGQLVYLSGWDEASKSWKITLADADVAGRLATFVLPSAIGASKNGNVRRAHRLGGQNTSGLAEGDPIYLSATAGGWTASIPASPSAVQIVGRVAKVSATVGVIEFNLFALDKSTVYSALHLISAFLTADAAGRAMIAANFFDAATVLAKFAASSFDVTAVDSVFTAGSIAVAKLNENAIRYASVSVSAAEIKALRATPKELVAAAGAGKCHEFVSAELYLDYGTTGFAEDGGGSNLGVKYTNGSGVQVSQDIESTGFIEQTADYRTNALAKINSITAKAGCENQSLVLHNIGAGEIVTGDSVMRVKVAYRTHTTGW